jgi:UDP-N-acetylglucosamine 1-carboxyvinyltransferase
VPRQDGRQDRGIGTSDLRIQAPTGWKAPSHTVLPDRIETGTYAFAVAAAGGDVDCSRRAREPAGDRARRLEQTGVSVTETPTGIRVARNGAASRRSPSRRSRSPASRPTCRRS